MKDGEGRGGGKRAPTVALKHSPFRRARLVKHRLRRKGTKTTRRRRRQREGEDEQQDKKHARTARPHAPVHTQGAEAS